MWSCAIAGCNVECEAVEDLLVHQATEHERHQCAVCGTVLPDGYFAIRHAFNDHSRAEYVRAYDADADAIRRRESVLEAIEAEADIDAVVARIDTTGDEEPTGSHAEP
jgi:predicted  nucleic acid-binding Zn-ribbon protein